MNAPISRSMPRWRKSQSPGGRAGPDRKAVWQGHHHALGEGEVIEDIQVVSTGSLGLDVALGVAVCHGAV